MIVNKHGGRRHSACQNHLGLAVAAMSGLVCKPVNVSEVPDEGGRPTYTCSCGEKATWFFIEQTEGKA